MNPPPHRLAASVAFAVAQACVSSGAAAAEWQYTAVAGDTPLRICRNFSRSPGCSLALSHLNKIPPRAPIAAGATIRIPAAWLKEVPIVGGVLEAGGEAHYRPDNGADFAPLVAGEPVYLGDTIRTGEGTAVLEFVSGLMIELRPHSVVVLQSYTELADNPVVNIDLESGSTAVASTGGAAPMDALAGNPAAAISGSAQLSTVPPAAMQADAMTPEAALASAERLLEEAPTAAGGAAAGEQMLHETGFYRVMHNVATPAGGSPAAFNSFRPARMEWRREGSTSAWQVDVLARPGRLALQQTWVVDEPMLMLPELAIGCYEVEIRPLDDEGLAGSSRRESLCVHPALAAPDPRAVAAGEQTGDIRIDWQAVPNAASYTVEIATDPAFERITRTEHTSARSILLRRGAAAESYLRVRASNAAGMNGPPGPVLRLADG